jgi:hypothetical protein
MFLPTAGADTQNRLLPPGLPFCFFAAAVIYHAVGRLVLLFSPEPIINFRGGPGPAPAARKTPVRLKTAAAATASGSPSTNR